MFTLLHTLWSDRQIQRRKRLILLTLLTFAALC